MYCGAMCRGDARRRAGGTTAPSGGRAPRRCWRCAARAASWCGTARPAPTTTRSPSGERGLGHGDSPGDIPGYGGQRGWAESVGFASTCWCGFACSLPRASVSPPRPQEQPRLRAREADADAGAALRAGPGRSCLPLGARRRAALHGSGAARPRRPAPLPALPRGRAAPVSPALPGTPRLCLRPGPPPANPPPLKADVQPWRAGCSATRGRGDTLVPLGAQLCGACGARRGGSATGPVLVPPCALLPWHLRPPPHAPPGAQGLRGCPDAAPHPGPSP